MKWIATAGLLTVLPLLAHHSVRAEYDVSKLITFKGTLTSMEWINPHAYIYVDVLEPDGKTTNWKFETASPNQLKFVLGKNVVKQGDSITLDAWVAKTGSKLASARTLALPDGRTVDVGDRWGIDMPK